MNCISVIAILLIPGVLAVAAEHPTLLFSKDDIPRIKNNAKHPRLMPVAQRLMQRAEYLLSAPPLLVSSTKRGEKDAPGELKGLEAARRLQGRVMTFCMAFTLSGEKKYRDAALAELQHALNDWKVWVDTAHQPPFDLMTGEMCMTYGLAYDWLYNDLSAPERQQIREGAERRGLKCYLDALSGNKPMFWATVHHNWNTVCNGGAAVLALALNGNGESALSNQALSHAVPNMAHYYDHIGADGGWDEGTGYWTYGNRYAFISAEALIRTQSVPASSPQVFEREGVKQTGYFPMIFNPGTKLSASFGDSTGRASDPIFYLLARKYKNADFIWFQDRVPLPDAKREGWPLEAFTLLWRPVDEDWLPESIPGFKPSFEIPPEHAEWKAGGTRAFPSIGWAMMAPTPITMDPPYFLAFKNGSLAANHTHLDLNQVSVAYGDTMLLVELGSRSYPGDYFGPKRYSYYEISTAGQNTVLIGSKGQKPGKAGRLLGPFSGDNYESLTGIADDAYEVPAPRVRRHVVFVKHRYWIILDDVAVLQPQTLELRFHTYGTVASTEQAGWTFEQDHAALDVIPALGEFSTEVQTPEGWIKPVHVLSLKTKEAVSELQAVTVLYPRAGTGARAGTEARIAAVSGERRGELIIVMAGTDQIEFELKEKGWQIRSVK